MIFPKGTGFIMFRIALPLTLLLLQTMLYFVAQRLFRERYPKSRWGRFLIAVPFVLFNGALLTVLLFRPRLPVFPDWFTWTAVYPFFIWHGATFFTGLFVLVGFTIKMLLTGANGIRKRLSGIPRISLAGASEGDLRQFDKTRRTFLRRSIYGITAASFAGNTYGLVYERGTCEMTAAEVAIRGLPIALDGMRIALVSDVHSSMFMTKAEMDRYVALVNSLHADLIVVPGDFVNTLTEEVYPFAEAFSNLRAPLGAYGVMGNHDFFVRQPEEVAREVDACGVKMLRNDRALIQKDGAQLLLLGIDDTGRPQNVLERIDTATGQTDPALPRILLCHRPYFLQEAAVKKIDLVLSGHTHGGQIVLGRFGDITIAPASLATKYVWGPYRIKDTHMYVSRGIGTVGLPIRINCPPEITTITLRSSRLQRAGQG